MKNAQAAELLGVSVQTIKRWKRNPARREALGAVPSKSEKQWRIPVPDSPEVWEAHARHRLNALGLHLKERWESELEVLSSEEDPILLETGRLLLAASLTATEQAVKVNAVPITQQTKECIIDLWRFATDSLARFVQEKGRVSKIELGRRLDEVKSILPDQLIPYWPREVHLQRVRAARKRKDSEKIRQQIDYALAILLVKQTEKKDGKYTTAEHLRPLLHKDLIHQINDTGEDLADNYCKQTGKEPPANFILKAPTPEELSDLAKYDSLAQRAMPRRIRKSRDSQGRVFVQVEPFPRQPAFVDIREPQEGIPLRTFRRRFPRKRPPCRDILNAIYSPSDLA